MRIALVGPYPEERGRIGGGVEAGFVNLVDGLVSLGGDELHVVTLTHAAASSSETAGSGVHVHRLASPRRLNNLTFYRSTRRALSALLDELRPDVVHAQDALGYGYVCLKASRSVPVVVTVHGIVRETRKALTRPRDRLQASLAGVAVERYCIRHAPHLLQSTPYPGEYFDGEIRGRIVDIPNAASERFFALEPAPEAGRVVFAGVVGRGKRVVDLVEAVARVPAASVRIAGPMPDAEYARELADRVQALRLAGRVELLGSLATEELTEEFRRASVLVLPSQQETSPFVIAEAMAAALPVVATRVGGIPHLVDDGRTGFVVDVGDVDALAQRVSELVDDEARRRSFAAAARAAAQEFRPAAVAARVRSVYDEVVG